MVPDIHMYLYRATVYMCIGWRMMLARARAERAPRSEGGAREQGFPELNHNHRQRTTRGEEGGCKGRERVCDIRVGRGSRFRAGRPARGGHGSRYHPYDMSSCTPTVRTIHVRLERSVRARALRPTYELQSSAVVRPTRRWDAWGQLAPPPCAGGGTGT